MCRSDPATTTVSLSTDHMCYMEIEIGVYSGKNFEISDEILETVRPEPMSEREETQHDNENSNNVCLMCMEVQ